MPKYYRTQQPCFDAMGENTMVCQTFVQGQRRYCSFPNKQTMVDYSTEDTYCNELLKGHIQLGYFDLDAEGMSLASLGWKSQEHFTGEFTTFLINQYEKHLGVQLMSKHVLWSTASTPEKLSYHIVVAHPDYYWSQANKCEQFKTFTKILEQESMETDGFHFLTERNNEIHLQSVLDSCVVSKNRCFRMLGCRKPSKVNHLEPLKDGKRVPITNALRHKFLITVLDPEGRMEPQLKTKFTPKRSPGLSRTMLSQLAKQYGSKLVKTAGSLIVLRNDGPRKCPIGGEVNESDNAFFVRKHNCLYLGCHNRECQGRLHKAMQLESRFKFYEDHRKILDTPKDERASSLIREYIVSTTSFVDRPDDAYLVSYSKTNPKIWNVESSKCVLTKTLFKGHGDIVVSCSDREKPVCFSGVLKDLLQSRKLKTYNDMGWCPYIRSNPVSYPVNKLNTFSNFALDNDSLETQIDFTQTRIFELLNRLCNFDKTCTEYLLNFIALRLQKVGSCKPGIALCFLNSKPGSGKGTLKEFLRSLFACHQTTVVSYNKLSQFTSQFNSELEHAIWLCLEEINSKVRDIDGLIKDMTTTEQIMLEPKGENRRQCDFYGTLLMFSNKIRTLNIARNDRRMCILESNSDQANCKEYFEPIYAEIRNLEVMRAAFLYFANRPIQDFDFRKFPKTKLREQVQKCSSSFEYQFYKHMFVKCLTPNQGCYRFSQPELYEMWRSFSYEYGSANKRDRGYVVASFESEFSPDLDGEQYVLQEANVRSTLGEIIGL